MRHPIATAAALAITAIVTACGGKDNARPVEDVTVQAGRYEGVFPAAYGPGTDVMLDLMTDGSFADGSARSLLLSSTTRVRF